MKVIAAALTLLVIGACSIWAIFGEQTLIEVLACFALLLPLIIKAYYVWDDSREL